MPVEILEALRNKLTAMNEKWEKCNRGLLEFNSSQNNYQNILKRIESKLMIQVYNAKDQETGKALYSNEKIRDAALQKKKEADDEYINYQDKQTEVSRKIKEMITEIEILKFHARNTRYMCDLELTRINMGEKHGK